MPTTDPNLSYYQQVQQDLASSNPATGVVGALGASAAPTVAQQQLGVAGIEQQMGDTGSSLQQQGDYADIMAGYQKAGLGINAEQTQLQEASSNQQFAAQQQGFQQTAQQNQLDFTNQLQSLIGGEAAQGASHTGGSETGQATLGTEYQLANEKLNTQEQLSAGQQALAQQNFGLIGEANGLSVDEVNARLQYGLEQLGEQADPATLAAQAGNALSGEVQGVGGTLSQAGLLGGLNALAGLG